MQHDRPCSEKVEFDLLTPSPGSGGRGSMGEISYDNYYIIYNPG